MLKLIRNYINPIGFAVWVRHSGHVPPLAPLYDGPYTVLQRSLRHFRLQMGEGRTTSPPPG